MKTIPTFGLICTVSILLFFFLNGNSQTTLINAANASGTSGADGSFENTTNTFPANGWSFVNGATNKWFVGSQTFCAGAKAAYVGTIPTVNTYNINVSDVSHFYKDVTFPAGQTCITLTFNYKCQGESGFDGLRIYIGSTSVVPVGGAVFSTTDPSASQLGNSFYNLQGSCTSANIVIPASFAGTTRRLVFSWQNDGSIGTAPATSIDGISLVTQNPTVPTCATGLVPANLATNFSTCNALTWSAPAASGCNVATSYDVYFGTSPTPPLLLNASGTTCSPVMNYATTYYWRIVPKNAAGDAVGCSIQSFTTGASSNPQFNLVDDATSASPFNCVTLTPDLNAQRGCAWDANSTMNFLANFQYEIDVNLGNNDAGADGMAFVLQNDPLGRCKCGLTGGAFGAGGISNSVTIEIDTYINYEDRDDFVSPTIGCFGTEEPDHLDVWFNGVINPDLDGNCDAVGVGERVATPNAVRLQSAPGVNYNIENGLFHKFRISWNAATSTLTASILNSSLTLTYGTVSTTFNPITVFGTNTPYFGFTGSTGGLSNQQIFCLPAVLLPLDLSLFEVLCNEGIATVYWKTESERENEYFTLSQSCDGIHFQPVSKIDGAGTSNQIHLYNQTINAMCPGYNYFQLSQTDANGEETVLAVKSIKNCSETREVFIYPNPANELLTIAWSSNEVEEIRIVDAFGKCIAPPFAIAKSDEKLEVDTSIWAEGVYFIRVQQKFGLEMHKIQVIH